jgi:hypothetical protein
MLATSMLTCVLFISSFKPSYRYDPPGSPLLVWLFLAAFIAGTSSTVLMFAKKHFPAILLGVVVSMCGLICALFYVNNFYAYPDFANIMAIGIYLGSFLIIVPAVAWIIFLLDYWRVKRASL